MITNFANNFPAVTSPADSLSHLQALTAPNYRPTASLLMEPLRLFTPGPVPIEPHILAIGGSQPPYNRTPEFSALTHEILAGLQSIFQTTGPVALLTASGTAAMEAAALNLLTPADHALIINGGTWGQRWCDICNVHSVSYDELTLQPGQDIDTAQLRERLSLSRYTALLVNAHETSTGQLYDIQSIGKIAREHGVLFIVDGISTICADPFAMDDWNVDAAILSSQKALALPPGLSFVAMNPQTARRLANAKPKSFYLDLHTCLENQKRGQLPFTPAIGLMLQLHQRLADIQQETLPELVKRHRLRAEHFRAAIKGLEFDVLPSRSSNAMTALSCGKMDASEVTKCLRTQYRIVVAPSGGELRSKLIRIAHMGAQKPTDVEILIAALTEIDATFRKGRL